MFTSEAVVASQLVNMSWQAEMKDGYWLGRDHPGVYLGERQALNEDYTHSGFNRGHLNPNGHHAGIVEGGRGSFLGSFLPPPSSPVP